MRVRVTSPFHIRDGSVTEGTILDISSDVLQKLTGLVEVLPNITGTWQLGPKAWVQNYELRTTGVFDDLASEIVKLTSDDPELQRHLLTENCQQYAPSHIWTLVEKWEERAAILEYEAGMNKEHAEEEAARRYNLMAFLPELRSGKLRRRKRMVAEDSGGNYMLEAHALVGC